MPLVFPRPPRPRFKVCQEGSFTCPYCGHTVYNRSVIHCQVFCTECSEYVVDLQLCHDYLKRKICRGSLDCLPLNSINFHWSREEQ
jgi:hypothetical protein